MNFIKNVDVKLTPAEFLLVINGLDYVIADNDRLNIDRALAEKTRQRLVNKGNQEGIYIDGD